MGKAYREKFAVEKVKELKDENNSLQNMILLKDAEIDRLKKEIEDFRHPPAKEALP